MTYRNILKKTDSDSFVRKFWKNHRVLSWLVILVVTGLIIIGGLQVFDYIKLLLGYDLTIRLSADKNDLNFINGQNETITFSIDRISRIFCNTQCEYSFNDLSEDKLLSEGKFDLKSPITREIQEKVTAPNNGEGQKVYSFDLICRNNANFICNTEGKNITRRTLITAEYYLSPEQLNLKQDIENDLKQDYGKFIAINQTFNSINDQASNLTFIIEKNNSVKLAGLLNSFESLFNENLRLWVRQDYEQIKMQDNGGVLLNQINDSFNNFSKKILENELEYNFLINNLSSIKQSLETLKENNFNQTQTDELNLIIEEFNTKTEQFEKSSELVRKQKIVSSLNTLNLSMFLNQTNETYRSNRTIIFNLEPANISIELINVSVNLSLPENKKICCLKGDCSFCKTQENYPIILLHGHNFNVDISADNSINLFDELQKKLENLDYLDAGELYLYEATREDPGILGMINKPIVIRASYYFDFLSKPEGYKSVQIKSENLDTYSIRLKEIIENVKYETQSPKVIIIAHSMGGLVARRYIQIFGNDSVDELILINTPNKGITGKTSSYCSIIGALQECEDMDSESLFINKLNHEKSDSIKTINIVGKGCSMDLGDGDGIVLKDNAVLDSKIAQNFFINGSCSGVDLLHSSVLDIKQHPELFQIINESLQ